MTLGTSVILAFLALANSVLTARGLGVDGRGVLASGLLVVSFAQVAGQMGLGNAFVLEVRQFNNPLRSKLLASSISISLAMGALIGVALTATGIVRDSSTTLALAVIAASMLSSLTEFSLTAVQLQSNLLAFNAARATLPLVGTGIISCFYFTDSLTASRTIFGLAVANLAALTISSIAIRPILATHTRTESQEFNWRRLFKSGMGYQAIALSVFSVNTAHLFILSAAAPVHQFGLYAAAYGLSRLLAPLQQAMGYAIYARSSQGHDESDRFLVALSGMRLTLIPLSMVACVTSALAPALLPALLGSSFADAVLPFSLLLVEGVLTGTAVMLTQPFQAQGHLGSTLKRHLMSLIPLLLIIPVLRDENVANYMSFFLLISACVRLALILQMYAGRIGTEALRLAPTKHDIRFIRQALSRPTA